MPEKAKTALKTAIDKAEADYANAHEDVEIIQGIAADFKKAVEVFESSRIQVDKTALLNVIQQCADLVKNEYDSTTWKALQTELKAAKSVYETEKITQKQVNDRVNVLTQAIKDLKKLDRSTLRATLNKVSSLKASDYTDTSWKVLEAANKKAISAFNEEEITQTEIDEANSDLLEAIKQLEVKKDDPQDDPKDEDPIKQTLTSNNVSVTGFFKPKTTLHADLFTTDQVKTLMDGVKDTTFKKQYSAVQAYDLYLKLDGKRLALNKDNAASISIPKGSEEKELNVITIDNNGNVTVLPTEKKNGKLYFKTAAASTYAIVTKNAEDNDKPNNGGTDDKSNNPSTNNGNNNANSNTPSAKMEIMKMLKQGIQ